MDTTIKVTSIHIIFGLIAALLSTGCTLGWFGFKNDVLAFFVAVIILYFVGHTILLYLGYFIYIICNVFIIPQRKSMQMQ